MITMRVTALAAAVLALGCAKLEKEKLPVVTTAGSHALEVGKTLMVTATTANGTDPSYAWESSAPAIATVDAKTGLVTGVKAGEAEIRATGASTGAVGKHPVVVFDASTMEPPPPMTNVGDLVPYYDKWMMSAHADKTAVPFNNWNMQGMIPVECARCHSRQGFIDYLGGDGTTPFVVDNPAPTGSVVDCQTCHNSAANTLTQVDFPSGVNVTGLDAEARCMTCHQGRSSGPTVDAAIAAAAPADDDTVDASLKFADIHYTPAAATLYGGRAAGGYEYAGQSYDVRFRHVDSANSCTTCHDPHSMNAVTVNAASKSGLPAGTYTTMFFLRAPYNPNDTNPLSNQTAQFCRQCHADKSNEMNGSTAKTVF